MDLLVNWREECRLAQVILNKSKFFVCVVR